ncbi:hypothetical protein [Nocardioides ferulae]|uniref:hypothetical protein n=1 Tax=Nocardioides ferulae TaxID=2340821 RepID=UPI00197EC6AC
MAGCGSTPPRSCCAPAPPRARRTVTNTLPRARYFSVDVRGFAHHTVTVTPAAVRLGPGESANYTIRVDDTATVRPVDDGWVVWRGATGTVTRVPVLLGR